MNGSGGGVKRRWNNPQLVWASSKLLLPWSRVKAGGELYLRRESRGTVSCGAVLALCSSHQAGVKTESVLLTLCNSLNERGFKGSVLDVSISSRLKTVHEKYS